MPASRTCFISGEKKSEVRGYFEKRRGGILKPKEDIKKIERRYAPLGVFELKRREDVKAGVISKVTKTVEKRNSFYVNLNNIDLYYAVKGFLGKARLDRSDVMEKIIDLPPIAVEFLSDIIRKVRITHHELNKKHFLFLDGNLDFIMMLKTRDLIEFHPRLYGAGYDMYAPHLEYISKVSIPDFDDKRYNLGVFLSTERRSLKEKEVDEIVYNPEVVLAVLEVFFGGDRVSHEMVYLPYDECMYVDREGRFRHERLIAPRFSTMN
jgi:hypothetical protein